MKQVPLLSLLAAVLLVSLSCRAEPPADSPFRPTTSVREVMLSVVSPSANAIWGSVGTVSNEKGTFDLEPRTDEEWEAVRRHAVTLIEATNLLLIPGRHVAPPGAQTLHDDDAEPGVLPPAEIEKQVLASWPRWITLAHGLHDATLPVLRAIDKKDGALLLTTGSELDMACETCHMTFWYPPKTKK